MKNAAEILRARGVGLSLTSGGTLSVTCKRPLTSKQQRWLSGHKAELVAELQGPKPTMAETTAETLIRAAKNRNWEVEFISTKAEVPPLPKEIVAELSGRAFPRRVIDSMSHSEAADWLFRDGDSTW